MLQMGLSQNRFPVASTEVERYKRKLSACWRSVAENECEHSHPLFISVQFRSLLMKGKTGKIFI